MGKSFVYCQVFESFCPLPLLYPSASDFQFRYAPVTVGSGRAACVHFSWVRSFALTWRSN